MQARGGPTDRSRSAGNASIPHERTAIDEVEGVGIQPEQLRLTPDERADLVAFVDGELPEAHSRLISTKLTQSATARREVEMLQKTWEMLDHLPLPRRPSSLPTRRFRRFAGWR